MKRYAKKLEVMIGLVDSIAQLSQCRRASIGCVIFPNDCTNIFSIGYNGPPRGISNNACTGITGKCGCAHAEANALAKLDVQHPALIIALTCTPCEYCANLILNTNNVIGIIYRYEYRDLTGLIKLESCGITCFRSNEIEDYASLEGEDSKEHYCLIRKLQIIKNRA